MRTVDELNRKVAAEIASFARLQGISPDQVTGFWDAVEARIGKDTNDKTGVAKRAAAVRYVVHHCPHLHMQLRQKLLAEAMRPNHEKQERAAKVEQEREDYSRFLRKPLLEEGTDVTD